MTLTSVNEMGGDVFDNDRWGVRVGRGDLSLAVHPRYDGDTYRLRTHLFSVPLACAAPNNLQGLRGRQRMMTNISQIDRTPCHSHAIILSPFLSIVPVSIPANQTH